MGRAKLKIFLLLLSLLSFCSGCSASRRTAIKLRLDGPAFPSGFKCAGLMVTGESIPTVDKAENTAEWAEIYNGRACPYLGLSTPAKTIAAGSTLEFSLYVPGGRKTTVQVLGVETTSGDCPTQTMTELFAQKKDGKLAPEIKGIYELGRKPIENLKSAVVDVTLSYKAESSRNLLTCFEGTSGSGSSGNGVFPYRALTLFSGDFYRLRPTKSGIHTFTQISGVGFGSTAGTFADYTAGANNATDVIRISDGTNYDDVTITVARITPRYWYRASSFTTLAEGSFIGAVWPNAGSSPLNLTPGALSANSPTNSFTGAPRGFPMVQIRTGRNFMAPASVPLSGDHTVLMVARRMTPISTTLFCLGAGGCTGGAYTRLHYLSAANSTTFQVSDGVSDALPAALGTLGEAWSLYEAQFVEGVTKGASLVYQGVRADFSNHGIGIFNLSAADFIIGGATLTGVETNIEVAELIVVQGLDNDVGPLLRAKYDLR